MWATPREIQRPTSEPELCRLVQRARATGHRIKVVGARHSFSRIWTTDDILVDLSEFHRVLHVDRERQQITVQGGMPLYRLVAVLERFGLALPNIGAWMEQTVAGVFSTATHGTSGRYRATLPEAVVAVRMVDGTGAVRVLEGDALRQVTLGLFGIATAITLQCRPYFFVEQQTRVLPSDEDAIERTLLALRRHDFVDLRWAGTVPGAVLGLRDIVSRPPRLSDRAHVALDATSRWLINRAVAAYPAEHLPPAVNLRAWSRLGRAYVARAETPPRVSPWYRGLTYDARGFAPPHDEIELALPRTATVPVLRQALAIMRADRRSAAIEVQVRFSPAIDMMLAPNDGRETMWLNLNVFDAEGAAPVVEEVCRMAYRHDARGHWAKIIPAFDRYPAERHPRRAAWEARRAQADPDGVFLNAWYERCFRAARVPGGAVVPRARAA